MGSRCIVNKLAQLHLHAWHKYSLRGISAGVSDTGVLIVGQGSAPPGLASARPVEVEPCPLSSWVFGQLPLLEGHLPAKQAAGPTFQQPEVDGLGQFSESVSPLECGRGDKRTKKGKRFKGSYGKARPNPKEVRRMRRERFGVGIDPPGTS
eukprot:TRINITY_DN3345_c0_g3_i1.p1 TRINITY_DN3345_c0_g3~~TRINITY_DN3345_c0_g3_i1.p1  ORF type:complete len:151 (+),score=18.95 TRINITY_DN3345_c0_g3_i1:96-548(+)